MTHPVPVGQQPASPTPGWYPDPSRYARLRWWDGHQWTLDSLGSAPTAGGAPVTAGWWQRVRGYLFDAAMLWCLSLMLLGRFHEPFVNEVVGVLRTAMLTGGSLPGPLDWWDYGLVQMWLVTAIPGIILRVCYDMVMLVWRGATLGHRRNGMWVVDDSRAPSAEARGLVWHKALRRSLVMRCLAPTCLAWLLCMLWPTWDSRSRTLADLAAGTRVVTLDQPLGWGRP